jgi:hypothetical protein
MQDMFIHSHKMKSYGEYKRIAIYLISKYSVDCHTRPKYVALLSKM